MNLQEFFAHYIPQIEAEMRAILDANGFAGQPIGADDIAVDLPQAPVLRRYTANDTSLESLGELLRQNPNGLLIERDELASLLAHLSQEENSGARGFYLTGADAKEGYTVVDAATVLCSHIGPERRGASERGRSRIGDSIP